MPSSFDLPISLVVDDPYYYDSHSGPDAFFSPTSHQSAHYGAARCGMLDATAFDPNSWCLPPNDFPMTPELESIGCWTTTSSGHGCDINLNILNNAFVSRDISPPYTPPALEVDEGSPDGEYWDTSYTHGHAERHTTYDQDHVHNQGFIIDDDGQIEISSSGYGFGLLLDQPPPSPRFSSPPSPPPSPPIAYDPCGRLIYAPRALKDSTAWADLLALDDLDINHYMPSSTVDTKVIPKSEQAVIPLIIESLCSTSQCLHQILDSRRPDKHPFLDPWCQSLLTAVHYAHFAIYDYSEATKFMGKPISLIMNEIKTAAQFVHQHALLLRDLTSNVDGPGVDDGLMRFIQEIGYRKKMSDVPASLKLLLEENGQDSVIS